MNVLVSSHDCDETLTKKGSLEEERIYLAYASKSQSIIKGHQGKSHGEVPFAGSSSGLLACKLMPS